MAEPKTTRLTAPAFAANGWLALAFAAVAAFAANNWLALASPRRQKQQRPSRASVAFAAFAAFAANGWLVLAAWAWAQDCAPRASAWAW